MTPSSLVVAFASRGIALSVKGDRISVNAPKGQTTPEDIEVLRQHKAGLLAYLAEQSAATSEPTTSAPRPLPWRPIVGGWPLSYRQRWGDRANALQDEGLSWHEAERLAFEELGGQLDDEPARPFPDPGGVPAWTRDPSLSVSMSDVRASIDH
jgi:hypothetical protein